MQKLTEVQIREWLEHPVTQAAAEVARSGETWLTEAKVNIYFEGQPHRTQEEIAKIMGRITELVKCRFLLTDLEYFAAEAEELDDYQIVRDDRPVSDDGSGDESDMEGSDPYGIPRIG